MKTSDVKSSTIRRLSWDGDLLVEFHTGAVYRYSDVPEKVYDELAVAESVGALFHRVVKGRYPFTQVS